MKHTITDELLIELHSEADLDLREKIENEVPGFMRLALEVGKWYKSDYPLLICVSEIHHHKLIGYGFNSENEFIVGDFCTRKDNSLEVDYDHFNFKPATDEEVEAALIGECIKLGIWNVPIVDAKTKKPQTSKIYGETYSSDENVLWSGFGRVFYSGKFATPLQPNTTLTKAIAEYQKAHDKFLNLLKNE